MSSEESIGRARLRARGRQRITNDAAPSTYRQTTFSSPSPRTIHESVGEIREELPVGRCRWLVKTGISGIAGDYVKETQRLSTSVAEPSTSRLTTFRTPSPKAIHESVGEVREELPVGRCRWLVKPGISGIAGECSRGDARKSALDVLVQLPPTKPAHISCKRGTDGKTVTLKSNFFKLVEQPEFTLQQFMVYFSPEEERTSVRKGLLKNLKDEIGPYIFDGTVLFLSKPNNTKEYLVESQRDGKEFKITFRYAGDVVYGGDVYIQLMNIILRKCYQEINYKLIGRNYFNSQEKISIDRFKLEVWPGITLKFLKCENDVLLRFELLYKILHKITVLDIFNEINCLSVQWKELFTRAMIGSVVLTSYNNKSYRVDDVDFTLSPLSTFNMKGELVSFFDFYLNRYNVKINNLRQPLLVSRPKARDIISGVPNLIVLIPELCHLTGLTDEMRSNFQLMKELNEVTRLSPNDSIKETKKIMERLLSNSKVKEELSLWNMKFSEGLVEFAGRILNQELIIHGKGHTSQSPLDADFTRNLRGQAMFAPANFNNWTILYPRKVENDVKVFASTVTKVSSYLDFRIPQPRLEELADEHAGTYIQVIEKVISQSNPQLLMCVLPNTRSDRYDAIKKKCCVDRPIPSQCILAKNLNSKRAMSIATRICIQMNSKIGGAAWSVKIPFKYPTMVVGLDVSRDSCNREISFGAIVISLDGYYTRYYSAVSVHTSGEELSNDICINLVKAVVLYKEINGILPPKIVIYRDGIGEGNEHFCLEHEVKNIVNKLTEVYLNDLVQLAFVIVSKRSSTRLFNNSANPSPGTIADDCVTHPERYDFFLISEKTRHGCVTPTYYNIIYDTTGLAPNILQRLTYKLTHLYYNRSGTISVPAPLQYAHKLSLLCSQHLHRRPNEGLNKLLYFL